ncbi:unnamed protein product [Rangifer tarandus platyrhynchus]|uniref:Uncharacterized protein n=2 Tax=Rangifer tarandus platyrhynchus TaxID=3082113 RepID=A0ABN8Y6M0_RANTA|nr:unnamed protein product [Rangifer tarandus platyrhynchus]
MLEWVAIPFSRGSSRPRDRTCISYIAGGFFTAEPSRKSEHINHTKPSSFIDGRLSLLNYFWLCWVFIAAYRLSLVAAIRDSSQVRYTGFSRRRVRTRLWLAGSVAGGLQ